jgi:hypothetical protein
MDSHPALKSALYAVLTTVLVLLLIVLVLCAPAFAGPMSRLLQAI